MAIRLLRLLRLLHQRELGTAPAVIYVAGSYGVFARGIAPSAGDCSMRNSPACFEDNLFLFPGLNVAEAGARQITEQAGAAQVRVQASEVEALLAERNGWFSRLHQASRRFPRRRLCPTLSLLPEVGRDLQCSPPRSSLPMHRLILVLCGLLLPIRDDAL